MSRSEPADKLLFTTKEGEATDLQGVIYDGLDVDYGDRVPALEHLAATGSPDQRLYATAMLASWGTPSALRSIAGWARAPESAPWAGNPVTFERFGGADSAFELLADALRISQDARGRDASTDALRAAAARALLDNFDRVYTGRKLAEVFDLDHPLRDAVASEIGPAVARGLDAARSASFDLATQTASLVGALAAVDDAAAATAAECLVVEYPDATRVHNEVAYSMRFGTGPATLAVLDRLAKSAQAAVRTNANESLALRRPG